MLQSFMSLHVSWMDKMRADLFTVFGFRTDKLPFTIEDRSITSFTSLLANFLSDFFTEPLEILCRGAILMLSRWKYLYSAGTYLQRNLAANEILGQQRGLCTQCRSRVNICPNNSMSSYASFFATVRNVPPLCCSSKTENTKSQQLLTGNFE